MSRFPNDALVKTFNELSATADQVQALSYFIDHLPHHHFETLKAFVNAAGARRDIVGNLPAELIRDIFLYLPIYQSFEARRVSQQWAVVLSPTQLTNSLTRSWFPASEVPLRIPTKLSSKAISALKAEHIHAYRSGRPFSRMTRRRVSMSWGDRLAYKDGIIAWITQNNCSCRLYWIETGQEKAWTTVQTESATHIAISSKVVSVITSSFRCQAWMLPNMSRKALLNVEVNPDGQEVHEFVASGAMIVLLYEARRHHSQVRIEVWSLGNETIHFDFQIQRAAISATRTMMIDHVSESIVYFELPNDHGPLYFSRFDLQGRLLAKGSLDYPDVTNDLYMNSFLPLIVDGSAVVDSIWHELRVEERVQGQWVATVSIHRVIFSLADNQLALKEATIQFTGCDHPGITVPRLVFFFKEVAYCWTESNHRMTWHVIDFEEMACRPAKLESSGDMRQQDLFHRQINAVLLGDETYLVSVIGTRIRVWCFDRISKWQKKTMAIERVLKPSDSSVQ